MLFDTFDYLIVGGGTSGCVLAARLSSRPEINVLLIEAGSDFAPGREPASIRDPFPTSYGDPRFAWPGLMAEIGADPGNQQSRFSRRYVQGRCLGGSSNLMGMIAVRGLPADYDEWRDAGATGWGWDDVLPCFKRCERDLDFNGPLHGGEGPIPIRRNPRALWPPFCSAFAESLQERGFQFLPDLNGQFEDGISAMPMSNLPDRRVSTAMGYLDAQVRRRPNLHIVANATVETLLCRGRRVVGANVHTPNGRLAVHAHQTVLCAGALHSPAILMRSGIGPGESLRELGIDVVADLPGVGSNLQNHPTVALAVDLSSHAWQSSVIRTLSFSVLRYSSNHHGCPPGDMLMAPTNKTAWHPLGRRIGHVGIGVYKAFSRGEVSLRAADPHVTPSVKMNLLSDSRDFERLVDGVRLALSVLTDSKVASLWNDVFLPPGGHAGRLNRPSFSNWLQSLTIRQMFGLSGALRRRILKKSLLDPAALLANSEDLRDLVRRAAAPAHHVCGTCKIGRAEDRIAVVDPNLRVHQMDGLRVADASIMPTIVCANTHMPVIMIAERAAELILADAITHRRASEQRHPETIEATGLAS